MQYLEIHSSGKVSFCAGNFGQDIHNKGYCRVKRLNIGARKAKELISLADQLTDFDSVTDCGSYTVKFNYSSGISREIFGSLLDDKMVIRNDTEISYSKLLRSYIPVYDLWGITDIMNRSRNEALRKIMLRIISLRKNIKKEESL